MSAAGNAPKLPERKPVDLEYAARLLAMIGPKIGNGGLYDRADQELLFSLAESVTAELARLREVNEGLAALREKSDVLASTAEKLIHVTGYVFPMAEREAVYRAIGEWVAARGGAR